jgi:hypothetical protein
MLIILRYLKISNLGDIDETAKYLYSSVITKGIDAETKRKIINNFLNSKKGK